VTGTNFVDGAKVLWEGQERATVFISTTKLTTTILQGDVANAGTYSVTVVNPNGVESGELHFEVTPSSSGELLPPPTLLGPGDPSSPGPIIDTLTPQFNWTLVPDADEYGLYIRNLNSDTIIFDSRLSGYTITGNTFTLPSGILQPDTHYRWNMNSHSSAGWNDDLVSGYSQKFYFTTPSGTQPQASPVIAASLALSPGPYKVGDTISATYTIRNDGSAAITFSNLTVGGRYDLGSIGDGTLPDGTLPDFTHRSITLQPGESYDYQGELTLRYGGEYHFFCAYSPYSGDPSGWNCIVPLANPGIIREVDIDVKIPVILIHGWRGSPDAWDALYTRLVVEGYPVIIFNYEDINKDDPREVAQRLKIQIDNYKLNSHYDGKFDIVCHSMGGLVSRYYIEHLGGEENIREWIGIAPATHGSAAADAFDWPLGPINWVVNSFWLGEARDQLRTDSDTVTNLKNDVSNDEIKYNVIVGVNSNKYSKFSHALLVGTPGNNQVFKSIYNSDTPVVFEMNGDRQHDMTYIGDGAVAVEQSKLSGAGLYYFEGLHHNELTNDALVISRIIKYLDNPDYVDYSISSNIEYNGYSDGLQGIGGILFDANKINHPRLNQIQSYEWDFGDGTKSYNAVTIHKYKKPGIYPVKLTITDQFGTKYTDTEMINIDEYNFYNIFGNYMTRHVIGRTKCPVNITITDSLGRKLNATVNEIPNSTFIQTDLYNDGEMGELFIILPPLDNYYNISVDAKPNAAINDSYSLDCVIATEFGDYKPIFLIENVTVNLDGTDDFNVEIPELLKAEFQFSPAQTTTYTEITFNDISTGNITSRLWSFGDGTSVENVSEVTHTYTTPGNYTVTLTVSDSDGEDSASQIIIIVSMLVPPPTLTNLHNTTNQQTSIMWAWTDPTSIDMDHVMVYLDGVFQQNVTQGVQAFTATGLSPSTAYTVGTRTVGTTGLINETWVNHTAMTAPSPPTPVPPASVTNLHNTTHQQTSITWAWTDPTSVDFDHIMVYLDGVFQNNVTQGVQSFTSTALSPATSYTIGIRTVGTTGLVNLTWVNHSATTAPEPVFVPAPIASFIANQTSGMTPFSVQFVDTSTSDSITTRIWSFGDGETSTDMNPLHIYTTPGTYTVSLQVTNGGGSNTSTKANYITATQSLPLVPDFEGTPLVGNAPLEVVFTDTSSGIITSRLWNFGDGMTVWKNETTTVSHTYSFPGTYTVSLTSGNEVGQETITKTEYIQVNPTGTAPVARFIAVPMIGYEQKAVRFSDRSMGTPLKWQWDFGDGSSSSEQNPSHAYTTSGRFVVTLTVFNSGGSSSYSSTVWMRPTKLSFPTYNSTSHVIVKPTIPHNLGYSPISFFTMDKNFGSSPMTVQFSDMSFRDPSSWEWDFDDGETSTLQNPTHTYNMPGTYSVSLTVKNLFGESTTSRRVYVR